MDGPAGFLRFLRDRLPTGNWVADSLVLELFSGCFLAFLAVDVECKEELADLYLEFFSNPKVGVTINCLLTSLS